MPPRSVHIPTSLADHLANGVPFRTVPKAHILSMSASSWIGRYIACRAWWRQLVGLPHRPAECAPREPVCIAWRSPVVPLSRVAPVSFSPPQSCVVFNSLASPRPLIFNAIPSVIIFPPLFHSSWSVHWAFFQTTSLHVFFFRRGVLSTTRSLAP